MKHVSTNLHTIYPVTATPDERKIIFHRLRKLTHDDASSLLTLIRTGITQFYPRLPRDVSAVLIASHSPHQVINGCRAEREAFLEHMQPSHADREILIRLFNLTVGTWPADYWQMILSL